MRRWVDLLLMPLLPVAPLITAPPEPLTLYDITIGTAFYAFLVWLWWVLRK